MARYDETINIGEPEKSVEVYKDRFGFFTTPPSLRGIPMWITYLMALLSFVYILNPTLGAFELIPDVLPIVGNLDEGAAATLIWYGLVEFFEGRQIRKELER